MYRCGLWVVTEQEVLGTRYPLKPKPKPVRRVVSAHPLSSCRKLVGSCEYQSLAMNICNWSVNAAVKQRTCRKFIACLCELF